MKALAEDRVLLKLPHVVRPESVPAKELPVAAELSYSLDDARNTFGQCGD